jgi:hypothetical protein
MGFAMLDDVSGPLRAGAVYINMNIAADGSRVSAARAFLQPNLHHAVDPGRRHQRADPHDRRPRRGTDRGPMTPDRRTERAIP